MRVIQHPSAASLHPFAQDCIEPGSTVHTDRWRGLRRVGEEGIRSRDDVGPKTTAQRSLHSPASGTPGRFVGERYTTCPGSLAQRPQQILGAHQKFTRILLRHQGTGHQVLRRYGDAAQGRFIPNGFNSGTPPWLKGSLRINGAPAS
jgi:hypothetical protein